MPVTYTNPCPASEKAPTRPIPIVIPRTFLFDSDQNQVSYAESLGALLASEISKSRITSQEKIEVLSVLAKIKPSVEISSAASINGKTALISAVEANEVDLVTWLLGHGVDIDATDDLGRSAVFYAVSNNNKHILRNLLGRGPLLNILDKSGKTLLEVAAHDNKLVEILLDAGADIELRNGKCLTLLDVAVVQRNAELVLLLVNRGAVLQRDTSLHISMDSYLVDQPTVDGKKGPNNYNGLHIATLLAPGLTQPVLLRFPASFELGEAAVNDLSPLVLALDRNPVDPDRASQDDSASDESSTASVPAGESQKKETGATQPLVHDDMAPQSQVKKDIALIKACESLNADSITKLLELGANPHAEFRGKSTATITVCSGSPWTHNPRGSRRCVQALINHGVDLNRLYHARLPSMLSAAALNLKPGSIMMLVNEGADLFLGDFAERLPIHFAAGNFSFDVFAVILSRAPGTMLALDSTHRSPLHYAAQFGNVKAVNLILNKIATTEERRKHVNQPDLDGWTPICWAIRGSKTHRTNTEAYLETMKSLFKHGAEILIRFPSGSEIEKGVTTPWHIAQLYSVRPQILDLVRREAELGAPGSTVDASWPSSIMGYKTEFGDCAVCLSVSCSTTPFEYYHDHLHAQGIHGHAYECKIDGLRICHKCYGIRHSFVYLRPLTDGPDTSYIVEDTFKLVETSIFPKPGLHVPVTPQLFVGLQTPM